MPSSFYLHIIFSSTLIISMSINPCASANLHALTISPTPSFENPPKNDQNGTVITAEYAFKIAYRYADKTLSYIRGELERTPKEWVTELDYCRRMYQNIVTLMGWAVEQLPIKKDPILLIGCPANSLVQLHNCQKGFNEGSHHPLIYKNDRMYSLLKLALKAAH